MGIEGMSCPPFAQTRDDLVGEDGFEGFAGGACLGILAGRLEAVRDRREPPGPATALAAACFLDVAVLGQRLKVPRHVAGALVENFARAGSRQLAFAAEG